MKAEETCTIDVLC